MCLPCEMSCATCSGPMLTQCLTCPTGHMFQQLKDNHHVCSVECLAGFFLSKPQHGSPKPYGFCSTVVTDSMPAHYNFADHICCHGCFHLFDNCAGCLPHPTEYPPGGGDPIDIHQSSGHEHPFTMKVPFSFNNCNLPVSAAPELPYTMSSTLHSVYPWKTQLVTSSYFQSLILALHDACESNSAFDFCLHANPFSFYDLLAMCKT